LRIGTVRRPPRGVPKADFARLDWYDVWYPELAPSAETMALAQEEHHLRAKGEVVQADKLWREFSRRYLHEMAEPAAARTIGLLAALSHHAAFSVGCYCQDEQHCHRTLLRGLLADQGASTGQGA
jgi:uncharacterized protein YeaO (DUF488 family)